jgi:TPP-dependent pyruvate/acetoin dehydrogenase alpha subunit
MSPADRMRASLLSSMGLTEDQLKNMSPEQQKVVEQKIEDLIKQAAQKQIEKNGGGGFFADIKA